MRILGESCLALLASIGLWTVIKIILQWIWPEAFVQGIYSVICVNGNADHCELMLRERLRKGNSAGIILLDCGLTRSGKAFVRTLEQVYPNVWVSLPEQLGRKVNEEWSKQTKTIK